MDWYPCFVWQQGQDSSLSRKFCAKPASIGEVPFDPLAGGEDPGDFSAALCGLWRNHDAGVPDVVRFTAT